jgi:hypothetical protein
LTILSDKQLIKPKNINSHPINDTSSKPNPWKDPSLESSGLKIKPAFTTVLSVTPGYFLLTLSFSPKLVLLLSGEALKIESTSSTKKLLK